jgi:septum formation protein
MRMGDDQLAPIGPDCNPKLENPRPAPAFHRYCAVALERLILASASPRRRELLAQLGVPFEVVPADVIEDEDPAAEPRAVVLHNAALKADWVAARHPGAAVLGADTTVFLDRTVLNKPRDPAEARAMLRRLSGRTHTVFTGLALRRGLDGLKIDRGVSSEVTFRVLSDVMIEDYLQRVHTLDKAGGYAIQEEGERIVESYKGSMTNIIGLPLEETKQLLTLAGLTR